MSRRVLVSSPGVTVVDRCRSLPQAVDTAVKAATAAKRRGRKNYKHYVRPVRHHERIIAWFVLKKVR